MNNTNKRKQGNKYEEIAANFLKEQGLFIKELNFYCKMGEIDIIAYDKDYIVFVEVKYRKDSNSGFAAEAVNYGKIRKICRTADFYLMSHKLPSSTNVRFDVIAIEGQQINYIRNAFEYIV